MQEWLSFVRDLPQQTENGVRVVWTENRKIEALEQTRCATKIVLRSSPTHLQVNNVTRLYLSLSLYLSSISMCNKKLLQVPFFLPFSAYFFVFLCQKELKLSVSV